MASSENAFLFIGATQIKFTPMGAPGVPTNFKLDGVTLSWSAGDVGSAGPTLGYGIEVEPRGPIVTVNSPDPTVGGTATLSNIQPDIEYTFKVYGVNQAGRGEAATLTKTFIYNIATGGSVKDVSNYNGSGQKWRVHTFTGNGTFNVEVAAQPFRALVVAGGGGGGYGGQYALAGGGGGGGGMIENTAVSIGVGAHPVTVGAGKSGKNNGGDSHAFGIGANGGGHGSTYAFPSVSGGADGGSGGGGGNASYKVSGGKGIPGQGHDGAVGSGSDNTGGSGGGGAGSTGGRNSGKSGGAGGAARTSTITGTSRPYAAGGGGGNGGGGDSNIGHGSTADSDYGRGGVGRAGGGSSGGQNGVVIVAYQIG